MAPILVTMDPGVVSLISRVSLADKAPFYVPAFESWSGHPVTSLDFNKLPPTLPPVEFGANILQRIMDCGQRLGTWAMLMENTGSTVAGLAPEEERDKMNGKMRRPDRRRAEEAGYFRQEQEASMHLHMDERAERSREGNGRGNNRVVTVTIEILVLTWRVCSSCDCRVSVTRCWWQSSSC